MAWHMSANNRARDRIRAFDTKDVCASGDAFFILQPCAVLTQCFTIEQNMWMDMQLLQLAHRHRAAWLLVRLGTRLAELMMGGLDMSSAWLEIQVEQHNAAMVRLHSHNRKFAPWDPMFEVLGV